MLFSFGASLDSEMYLIGNMSGRKERSEGKNGEGGGGGGGGGRMEACG